MTKKQILLHGTAALVFVCLIFGGGFYAGFRAGILEPKVVRVEGVSGLTPQGDGAQADFGTFWQAWDEIDKTYLRAQSVGAVERVSGAVRGLVQSLGDPYSEYFDPVDSKKFEEDVEGNFGGIGAEIGMRKNQVVVIAPLEGTPAKRADLRPGDAIFSINGSSTEGITVEEAVQMIRGPKGSTVTLTIFREGTEAPKDIPITRETIAAPTLDFKMLEGNIAYVELYSFNANASQLFSNAMLRASAGGARGMILDLRNNPGGYLEVAVDLAGWFVPKGKVVVSEESRTGIDDELHADGNAALLDFPVVLLVNGGSASAAEILAGALHDIRETKLIGEQTFGKGTVQQIVPLRDGASMKLTIAHWVLPSGTILDGKGLEPDIKVVPSEDDITSGNDVQLTKAIETLGKIIEKGS